MRRGFIKGALCGALAMLLVIGLGEFLFLDKNGTVIDAATKLKLESIQSVINREFFYKDDIDEDLMREYAIKGYVDGLGDPYSVYYNVEETKELLETTSGEFTGIGVSITQDPETKYVKIVNVYKDSPGEKAGLLADDIIYKVDGEDVTTLDIDQVASKIRGEEGTSVEIVVFRGANYEEFATSATRARIEIQSVEYEMKEDNIGYIAISAFAQSDDSVLFVSSHHLLHTLLFMFFFILLLLFRGEILQFTKSRAVAEVIGELPTAVDGDHIADGQRISTIVGRVIEIKFLIDLFKGTVYISDYRRQLTDVDQVIILDLRNNVMFDMPVMVHKPSFIACIIIF